ncbi:FtsX-like permease family protein [Rhodocytophaga rosea]|uniref:FtsX-like permease family protein n=1 Tax=Rhodocytophaga rosea TaxID=2704465 RepID=A0A6C0GSY3_9BACT|nr:ABC transporter permease [Rhodocytophaga rosea]QHT71265.1 FtsX-like permease family protein [Rhodocytophaga rosea]
MLKNYLTIALRTLSRQKAYTFINIAGLATGLACCFLILLFVFDELSYDTFQQKASRIYRLQYEVTFGGNEVKLASTPPPFAPLLTGFFPEIETAARVYQRNASLQVNGKGQSEKFDETVTFADSTMLDILSFDFVSGTPRAALDAPFSVIISDEMAVKYFGKEQALGKALLFEGRYPMKITGVFKKYPNHSHIHFNVIANYETMFATEIPEVRENLSQNRLISHSYTYVLLKPNQSVASVNKRFPAFLEKYGNEQLRKDQNFSLQPLLDIHLYSDLQAEPEPGGDIMYVYLFTGIAFITLLIACINFINLATASSLRRTREVGVRKVLGAYRIQLIGQFLGESLLISLMAFIISVVLVMAGLPLLNELTGKQLSVDVLGNWQVILAFFGLFVAAGMIAGSYPAFFVSGFQSVESLKGTNIATKAGGVGVRKVLVVTQFTVSIALMAGALVSYQQLQYLQNRPLGFGKEHTLVLPLFSDNLNNIFGGVGPEMRSKTNAFEEAIAQNPKVKASTLSSGSPGNGAVMRNIVPQGFTQEDNIFVSGMPVDYDFISAYGMEIIAGRDFSKTYGTDHLEAFIINEKAVQQFKWGSPQEAIGKTIDREGKKGKVIGVVKDFHYQSLQAPIEAFVFDVNPPVFNTFSIKVQSDHIPQTIEFLEKKWNEFFPERAFSYAFLDETINEAYNADQRLGKIIGYFAFLAIFISGLGLFGLASFTTAQRTKEIGIRKVLGASIPQIVGLLYKDFALLVGISFVVAIPLAWYVMNKWLADFAYSIPMQWWMFALPGLLVTIIALLTVSWQSIKAALANPVKSLRNE